MFRPQGFSPSRRFPPRCGSQALFHAPATYRVSPSGVLLPSRRPYCLSTAWTFTPFPPAVPLETEVSMPVRQAATSRSCSVRRRVYLPRVLPLDRLRSPPGVVPLQGALSRRIRHSVSGARPTVCFAGDSFELTSPTALRRFLYDGPGSTLSSRPALLRFSTSSDIHFFKQRTVTVALIKRSIWHRASCSDGDYCESRANFPRHLDPSPYEIRQRFPLFNIRPGKRQYSSVL